MGLLATIRLIILFAVAFSLASLAGVSGAPRFPGLTLVRALSPPNANPYWYPAGPEMSTLFMSGGYSSQAAEFTDLEVSPGSLDFVDVPLLAALGSTFSGDSHLALTLPQSGGFNEVEFNMAANFWGCPFNFGNTVLGPNGNLVNCGTYVRQGIAHLVDKKLFAQYEPDLSSPSAGIFAVPIDNPLSANGTLPTPNACGWDLSFGETGSNCVVGTPNPHGQYYTGGTAYHLAPATGATSLNWLQNNPSPDFCAGAWDIMTGLNSAWSGAVAPGLGVSMVSQPGGGFPYSSSSYWTFTSSTNCQLNPCCGSNEFNAIAHITNNPVKFFIRTDNPALQMLGQSYAEAMCAVWSGSFVASNGHDGCTLVAPPCCHGNFMDILETTLGNRQAFQGFLTSTGSSPNTNWGMFTAGAGGFVPPNPFEDESEHVGEVAKALQPDPFDTDLYFGFNSQFVSGISSVKQANNGACSNAAVPSGGASNYMWLCNSSYDNISGLMESAPCFSSTGSGNDPVPGQSTPNFASCLGGPVSGTCTSTSICTAVSAGYQAEDNFGQGAYTIPVYSTSVAYGYLLCAFSNNVCTPSNSWTNVINSQGTYNYFNWLNARNGAPRISGTIRQGFVGVVPSVNPYVATTPQEFALMASVYDSLFVADPYNDNQFVNWMTENTQTLTSVSYNSGGLNGPPLGTAMTYRFTLRPDLTFQDGRPVTSYDVAFSYLSLFSQGALLGETLAAMTGITILSPQVFDVSVNSKGVFVLPSITSVPILSARYWTSALPSDWGSAVGACSTSSCPDVQFTLSGTTVKCTGACTSFSTQASSATKLMTVNTADLSATFDPIKSQDFVGSGPWECGSVTGVGNGVCTPSSQGGAGNGQSSYTLTAFQNYFRSSQRLALYLWSGESDTNAIGPAVAVGSCFNVAVNLSGPCGHYQQGAGNPGSGTPVSVGTVGNVDIFFNLNWLAPFEWTVSPPAGIAPLPPVFYGPSTQYTPNPGGTSCTTPNTYYDC